MIRFTRRLIKGVLWAFVGLVVLAALVIGGLLIWLGTSEPEVDGAIQLAGLEGPVTVLRDARGIVHIQAEHENDAYFALGFSHAQDRMPQMEQMRRAGAGRLAEIAPFESVIELDRFARTLGLYRLAQDAYESMAPDARAAVDAYVAGVNAYLDTHDGAWSPALYGRLPVSLDLDDYRPEPWKPADSMVWAKLMSIYLGGWNFAFEIERIRVEEILGPALTNEYYPEARESLYGPTLQNALGEGGAQPSWRAAADDIPPAFRRPWDASNAWVVDGTRTASGMPLLANDPHLRHGLPGTWYLVHIETPTLELVGGTTPGVPFHILGHNTQIAWGFTTTHSDMADTFIEELDPEDSTRYRTPDGWAEMEVRSEVIGIGGDEEETLEVRSTRHGPVISGLEEEAAAEVLGEDQVLTLSAPYLFPGDTTAEGMYRINRATDWESFHEAASLFIAPQQNMHYADTAGNIGFYAPAHVPIRAAGDGLLPAIGWTGEFDWVDRIPVEGLPQVFNPESHQIVNANNRLVDEDYPYYLGSTYDSSYRSDRIGQMLEGRDDLTVEDFRVMQHDVLSLEAVEMLPLMLDTEFSDQRAQLAAARLSAWDGRMDAGWAEPLIFEAWIRELNRAVYADEVEPIFDDIFSRKSEFITQVLTETPHWCDDVTTDAEEDCGQILEASLLAALDFIATRFGDDIADWDWGDAHVATFRHQVLGMVPLIGDWLDASVPTGGSWATVMRGGTPFGNEANPFRNVHGAGLRAVYDLSDLDQSVFSMAPGQSDNPFSPYWANLVQPWADGAYFPIPTSWAQAEDLAVSRLILRPVP